MSDSPKSDREVEMARRNAEIDASVKSGAPVKPWNPVHIAKRAKKMSKEARQRAAAAGLVAVLAGLGLCTANAGAPTTASDPLPQMRVNLDPPPGNADPVGAKLEVTPTLIMRSGGCEGSIRLSTQTITNPAPYQSMTYQWEAYTVPRGCGGTYSVELDYAGVTRREAAIWDLFPPHTTARQFKPSIAGPRAPGETLGPIPTLGPGHSGTFCTGIGTDQLQCSVNLVLIVTNEPPGPQRPTTTSRP